jgi:hypothetical protein
MELIVTKDLSIAAVAIDVARTRGVFLSLRFAARVVDQPGLGVARGGQAALLVTDRLRARAALESLVPCRTRTGLLRGRGLVAGLGHLTAAHGGVSFVEHTVSSDRETSVSRSVQIGRPLGE